MIFKLENTSKRLAIDKSNTQIVVAVSVAAFIIVFCLFAAKALVSQIGYQSRVISASDKTKKQLKLDISNFGNLSHSYNNFISQNQNIIGGSATGNGSNDGTNAKIILDALPDQYDFPELTSSLYKLLQSGGYSIASIGGTDEQLTEQNNNNSPNPTPVPMPFSISVQNANYTSAQQLINTMLASIRPMAVDNMNITASTTTPGGPVTMTMSINAHTYYQPSKTLSITKQVVK